MSSIAEPKNWGYILQHITNLSMDSIQLEDQTVLNGQLYRQKLTSKYG